MTEQPAYRLIYESILKQLEGGRYPEGAAIPSENELAEKYGVSRMTARKAVDLLVAEGFLFRHKGRGTFPTGRRESLREELSLSARLLGQGRRVYTEVLAFKTTVETDRFNDQLEEAVTCWRIDRLRYVEDRPALFERVWIPVVQAEALTAEDARGSLVDLLARTGPIELLSLEVRAERFRKKAARALGQKPDQPGLLVRGCLTRPDKTVCLWSEGWQDPIALPLYLRLCR